MSSKDEHIFSKEGLMSTHAGRDIMKQAMFKSKAYKQFQYYKESSEDNINKFIERFTTQLYDYIRNDKNHKDTLDKFVKEVGSEELSLEEDNIAIIKERLSDINTLRDRVNRIINSNFVKMTLPVFTALLDGADKYYSLNLSREDKNDLIDGHIIAIDLSEPMDRIIDKDEDLEYLDDYRLMNPYILKIARDKISKFGDQVLETFENGFKDAREGQYIDYIMKKNRKINYELMDVCYKKYRAIMGTAGKNMALAREPLGEIFYYGMAKAGESVGCGNELEDSLKNKSIKIPSWPLYYISLTDDIKEALDLTLQKSDLYLEEAKLALDMLPDRFDTKPFIEFLFLTVKHYNQYWYNKAVKG
ncbi:MAG: hypothetical protein D6752_02140, partial [Candidatus Nitrosothermus koennekii]